MIVKHSQILTYLTGKNRRLPSRNNSDKGKEIYEIDGRTFPSPKAKRSGWKKKHKTLSLESGVYAMFFMNRMTN
jgi:hypothetical protein